MVMLEYVLELLTAARGLKEVNGEDCTMEHPFPSIANSER